MKKNLPLFIFFLAFNFLNVNAQTFYGFKGGPNVSISSQQKETCSNSSCSCKNGSMQVTTRQLVRQSISASNVKTVRLEEEIITTNFSPSFGNNFNNFSRFDRCQETGSARRTELKGTLHIVDFYFFANTQGKPRVTSINLACKDEIDVSQMLSFKDVPFSFEGNHIDKTTGKFVAPKSNLNKTYRVYAIGKFRNGDAKIPLDIIVPARIYTPTKKEFTFCSTNENIDWPTILGKDVHLRETNLLNLKKNQFTIGSHKIDVFKRSATDLCEQNGSIILKIVDLPKIIPVSIDHCNTDKVFLLNNLTSYKSGVWSGEGVDPVNKTFDASNLKPGAHIVTYTVKNEYCSKSHNFTINTVAQPDFSKIIPLQEICYDETEVNLYSLYNIDPKDNGNFEFNGSQKNSARIHNGVFTTQIIKDQETFSLNYSVKNGNCTYTKTLELKVQQKPSQPLLEVVGRPCVEGEFNISLRPKPNGSFKWFDEQGEQVHVGRVFITPSKKQINYTVYFESDLGCKSDPLNIQSTAKPLPAKLVKSEKVNLCLPKNGNLIYDLNTNIGIPFIYDASTFHKREWFISGVKVNNPSYTFASEGTITVKHIFQLAEDTCPREEVFTVSTQLPKEVNAGADIEICANDKTINLFENAETKEGVWGTFDTSIEDFLDPKTGIVSADNLPHGTHQFYLTVVDGACEIVDSKKVIKFLAPEPIEMNPVFYCDLSNISFSYSGVIPNGYIVRWYNSKDSDAPIEIGSNVTNLNLSKSKTPELYYALEHLEHQCDVQRKKVRLLRLDNQVDTPTLPDVLCKTNASSNFIDLNSFNKSSQIGKWSGQAVDSEGKLYFNQITQERVLLTYTATTKDGCVIKTTYNVSVGIKGNFSVSNTTINVGESIQLLALNLSDENAIISWNIESIGSRTGTKIKQFFNEPGSYKIKVTVASEKFNCGQQIVKEWTVDVLDSNQRGNREILSVSDLSKNDTVLKIYPTLVSDQLKIVTNQSGEATIQIYNFEGSIVANSNVFLKEGENILDRRIIQRLPQGLLLVSIQVSQTKQLFKIIKS